MQIQIDTPARTISEIVVDDYRTAAIFEKNGLDFCCRGNRSITEACQEKGVNQAHLLRELSALQSETSQSDTHLQYWGLDFLADYIVQNHHGYIRATAPAMKAHVIKIADVHGAHHPELLRVRDIFLALSDEMAEHMQKEEQMLFPYIKQLVRSSAANVDAPSAPFGSVENPINMMRQEHEAAGAALEEIRRLTENYVPPEDACTTYAVTLEELAGYERDLHRHVHLENNILFPRAEKLEDTLRSVLA